MAFTLVGGAQGNDRRVQSDETGADAAMCERIEMAKIAADERKSQRKAENERHRITEENTTKRFICKTAAVAAVALAGVVAIALLGQHKVNKDVVYQSIASIVAVVAVGSTNSKDLRSYLMDGGGGLPKPQPKT